MIDGTDIVTPVHMPQENVNDEEVRLVAWQVNNGERVDAGDVLCEMETSKAVGELASPASGVLRQVCKIGDMVPVGSIVAYIGPSQQAIDRYINLRMQAPEDGSTAKTSMEVEATAGALELARRYGIDLADVKTVGQIRRQDVESFIAQHGLCEVAIPRKEMNAIKSSGLPEALEAKVVPIDPLSDHQWAIAGHLARTQANIVSAHAGMDLEMTAALRWIEDKKKSGQMTGSIPVFLYAAAAAVAAVDKLAGFRIGRQVYRYKNVDIAYTARSSDGRLFTPVIRNVDQKTLDDLSAESQRLNMAVYRGTLETADMSGGCLTLSVLDEQPVRFHIGLQNAYQSVLFTIGAIREELRLVDGKPVGHPTATVTLSYDHGLMDGWEAGQALAAMKQAIESVKV
ncbi:MAG: hypothetical protein GXY44_14565 [Phycisphaerales bacterium]|nr:hypothetical protein [Phycisphaerales bacterium]